MAVTTIFGSISSDLITLQGSEYADSVTIENNNLYIDTLEGKDTITGSTSAERLTIETGTGDDTLLLTAEVLNSNLILGIGDDYLLLNDFSGSIYGGAGDDSIEMTQSRTLIESLIRGYGGKDVLSLDNITKSIINTNTDDDMVTIGGNLADSQIYTGRQKDVITISGSSVNSLIRGDANQDTITVIGDLNNSVVNGNADDDELIIRSSKVSSSTIYGGKGIDNIDIFSDAIHIDGGKGSDDIDITSNQKHTVYGGAGDDTIDSDSTKALYIDGGDDKDWITISGIAAENTAHTVDGGAAADSITGNSGNEVLDGGTEDSGEDTLISGGGDDTIYGRAGDDFINLQAGNNAGNVFVRTGGGDDIIQVKLDELKYQDTIKGDAGTDTLAIVGTAADFNMYELNTEVAKAFDSISSIETLAFGSSDSSYVIAGTKTLNLNSRVQSAGIKTIDVSKATGFGSDVLEVSAYQFTSSANVAFVGSDDKDVSVFFTGGSGNDTLTTGKITEDGADTLKGSIGEDTFIIVATDIAAQVQDLGAGGLDTLIVADVAKGVIATVTEDYHAPTTTSNSKSTADVVLNAESHVDINMIDAGGLHGYTINGGIAGSRLQGSKHNDSITGNSSDDILIGNKGDDTLTGGEGSDTFKGGSGNDRINDAGNGNDFITHDSGSLVVQNAGSNLVTVTASSSSVFIVATAGERRVDASTSSGDIYMDGSASGLNKITYTGGNGNDTIMGGQIEDTLTGNGGNDIFTGGLLTDTINVGDGVNTVVFTSGLSSDVISGFTDDDIGSFDLSDLETNGAVTANEILDFVTGSGTSVAAGDVINMQTITGNNTVLTGTTNVLHYTSQASDADALEIALENGGNGIITTDGALAENDAFIIQYQDFETNSYSYAIAHLQGSGVNASSPINSWEVIDIATTNLLASFSANQFSFIT